MVNLYVSYSQPINAPGVAPTLGRRQVWAGLQRKVRDPTKFVPVITSCVVLEDKDNVVTREVHFVEGFTDAPQPVREVCKECYPTKIDFIQPNGAVIQNLISDGPTGTYADLSLTYTFEHFLPNVEAWTKEEKDLEKKYKEGAKMAVIKTIEAIRNLVVEGVIA